MSHKKARSAVITGASQGIGKAIALALIDTGVHTVLASRSKIDVGELAAESPNGIEHVTTATLDLSNLESVRQFAAQIGETQEDLDILINCGGTYARGTNLEASTQQLDNLFATNVRGTFALTQALLPMLIKTQGDVVFINSSIIQSPAGGVGQFAATQHALKAIADSLRAEVNAQGVRVLSLYPGRTATPRQDEVHQYEARNYDPQNLLQPADIAEVVISCLNLAPTAEVTDLHIRPRQKGQ